MDAAALLRYIALHRLYLLPSKPPSVICLAIYLYVAKVCPMQRFNIGKIDGVIGARMQEGRETNALLPIDEIVAQWDARESKKPIRVGMGLIDIATLDVAIGASLPATGEAHNDIGIGGTTGKEQSPFHRLRSVQVLLRLLRSRRVSILLDQSLVGGCSVGVSHQLNLCLPPGVEVAGCGVVGQRRVGAGGKEAPNRLELSQRVLELLIGLKSLRPGVIGGWLVLVILCRLLGGGIGVVGAQPGELLYGLCVVLLLDQFAAPFQQRLAHWLSGLAGSHCGVKRLGGRA